MTSSPIYLHGKNYQSLDEFNLELRGFTAVVGATDLGKSALSRAIRGVLRNEISAGHIRLGQPNVEVTMTFDNHSIKASRTKKGSTVYDIDGEPYTKLNQAIPKVIEDMGFGEIEIGEVSIDPIFAEQGEPQFLVDKKQSPQSLNTILSGFAATERLDQGKKVGKERIAEKNSEAKLIATEIQAAEEQKAKLLPIAESAEAINASLAALYAAYQQTAQVLQCLITLRAAMHHRASLRTAVDTLQIPDVEAPQKLYQIRSATLALHRALTTHDKVRLTLKSLPVVDIKQAEKALQILTLSKVIQEASQKQEKHHASVTKLEGVGDKLTDIIKAYKILQAASVLRTTFYQISYVERGQQKRAITKMVASLEAALPRAISSIKTVQLLGVLIQAQNALDAIELKVVGVEGEMQQLNEELNTLTELYQEAERKRIAAETAVECPDCGTVFSSQHNHGAK